jgi:uncharacterized protein YbaA (DUF1428 family)
MRYVDGFLLPIPKRHLAAYRTLARKAGKVWMEHGALQYCECAGDDLKSPGTVVTFPKSVRLKRGEVVFFSWIAYKSRAHRDRVNAKVMKDPRMLRMMEKETAPFDMRRMAYGGFQVLVDL